MEECTYDYFSPCFYMLGDDLPDHRAGLISIANKTLTLEDIEMQGAEQDRNIYKQNISYLSDIPLPTYSQDKDFPFFMVRIQGIPHRIQLLPSDFYHLQLTLKKSRLTPQVQSQDQDNIQKFLRSFGSIIPWKNFYHLVNESYPMALYDRELRTKKDNIDFIFNRDKSRMVIRNSSGLEESFKYYELYHFLCPNIQSNPTPAKGHNMKFEIGFKKNNLVQSYWLELANDHFDMRARNGINFFKDFRSFLEGNSAMWWGKKPFENENYYKLELKNQNYKKLLLTLKANHRDHRENKLFIKEGDVESTDKAQLRDLTEPRDDDIAGDRPEAAEDHG